MSLATVEKKFLTVMEAIGHDAKVALSVAAKYAPEAAALASLIFPAQAATLTSVVNATELIQTAVTTIEQKYAASGAANGTGAQKLADVLSLVTPTVTQLLSQEGLHVDNATITNIVNAVVAILNVRTSTVAAA